jgi:hypothetical protein
MINSYQKIFEAASKKYDVPDSLLTAQAQQESGFNPNAVSSAGAQGLMQFMPATAQSIGLSDPFSPSQAIPAAAKYDAQLYDATGNWQDALIAYNEGPTAEAQGLDYTQSQKYATDILKNAGMEKTSKSSNATYYYGKNGDLNINFGGNSGQSGTDKTNTAGTGTSSASGSGSCTENDTPILSIAGYALITPCGLFDLVVGILGIVFIVAGFKSDVGKMVMQAAKSIPLE